LGEIVTTSGILASALNGQIELGALEPALTGIQAQTYRKIVRAQPAFLDISPNHITRLRTELTDKVFNEVLFALEASPPATVESPAAYLDEIAAEKRKQHDDWIASHASGEGAEWPEKPAGKEEEE
jgi:hypothetical protein